MPLFFKREKNLPPKTFKEILKLCQKLEEEVANLTRELQILKRKSNFFVQKVGIVRFNPFEEIGGDQSFSIALLDAQDNGVVLTSLYNREGSKVYAKPIIQGVSKYQLSKEEKEAIDRAKKLQGKNSKSEI